MNPGSLPPPPPLPRIEGDLMLSVFIHQSLNMTSGHPPTPQQYDNDRLAELGEQALNMATTHYLYSKQPPLPSDEIRSRRTVILDESNIDVWLNAYDLKMKLRCAPESNIREDPRAMKRYFLTYVGAVFVTDGISGVENWIIPLIDPNVTPHAPQSQSQSQPLPPQYYPPHPLPPPPSSSPPPLPVIQPSTSNLPASNSMSWLSLALVNQTAVQKQAKITYTADSPVGQAHAPIWTVRCLVNDVMCGIGTGKNQKIAKEMAAKQAFLALGWDK